MSVEERRRVLERLQAEVAAAEQRDRELRARQVRPQSGGRVLPKAPEKKPVQQSAPTPVQQKPAEETAAAAVATSPPLRQIAESSPPQPKQEQPQVSESALQQSVGTPGTQRRAPPQLVYRRSERSLIRVAATAQQRKWEAAEPQDAVGPAEDAAEKERAAATAAAAAASAAASHARAVSMTAKAAAAAAATAATAQQQQTLKVPTPVAEQRRRNSTTAAEPPTPVPATADGRSQTPSPTLTASPPAPAAAAAVVPHLDEESSRREQVYVFLRDESGAGGSAGRGFTYTTELNPRELIEAVVRDAGLPADGSYVLGIAEIGLYFSVDDKPLPMRRCKFVQACCMVGIPPILELFCTAPGFVVTSVDADTLAQAIMADLPLLQRGVGASYVNALAMFREEVAHVRRSLTLLRTEGVDLPPVPGEDPDTTAYIRQELAVAYRGSEPPLKDPSTQITFVCTLPGASEPVEIQCRADILVMELMNELFPKIESPSEPSSEEGGGGEPSQAEPSTVDPAAEEEVSSPPTAPKTDSAATATESEPLGPDDYVLKVSGMNEYIVPLEENRTPLTLDSFDYIRKCVANGDQIFLTVVPRAVLHVEEEPPSPLSGITIIDTLLTRDVWRESDHLTDFVPMSTIGKCFHIKISNARRIHWPVTEEKPIAPPLPYHLYVVAGIYHGGRLCAPLAFSPVTAYAGAGATWDATLEFGISGKRIPKEARFCLTLYAAESSLEGSTPSVVSEKHTPLGWCNFLIFDHLGRLRTGDFRLRLWDGAANPIGTCMENTTTTTSPPLLAIMIEPYAKPAVFVPYKITPQAAAAGTTAVPKLKTQDIKGYKQVIMADPLIPLEREDMERLWEYRELVRKSKPRSLAKVLRAVDWTIPDMVREAHRLLMLWEPLKPTQALELLDSKFADGQVREYAVRCLDQMTDAECGQFLLQLIQVLKYEPYHDSPLARFLLARALRNKNRIGHVFYWGLKAEMGEDSISERYGILLEMYLRGCGARAMREIENQNKLLSALERVAMGVKAVQSKEERSRVLQEGLSQIEIPEPLPLPLDPRFYVRGLLVPKCRFMDSKKLPLWLVFDNEDQTGKPIYTIFKVGDDIRQDILTLQMMRVMDGMWKRSGMDLRMQLYRCVATADSVGMIEVVLNSETTYGIAVKQGGASAILADSTITDWLRQFNQTPEEWERCVETFMLSCAGYNVATYVLGIGDRHASNLMISRRGHFFHIDFGHFLGNFKSKLGVKRERAPFKFTTQFAHVFGGAGSPDFKKFQEICCQAYNLLRRNSDLFISLFGLMLSTGIPELKSVEDISYLRSAFSLDLDDMAADEKFKKKIAQALHATSQTINDMFHHLKHKW